jgi:gas vesicle structural protein
VPQANSAKFRHDRNDLAVGGQRQPSRSAIERKGGDPMTTPTRSGSGVADRPSPSGLADVIDTILDKGLVIDAYVRVALVGIELLTIDARIVVASVDTYLRFAEACNRLELSSQSEGLPQLIGDMTEGGAQKKTKGAASGALEAAGEKLREFTGDDTDEASPAPRGRRREGN